MEVMEVHMKIYEPCHETTMSKQRRISAADKRLYFLLHRQYNPATF